MKRKKAPLVLITVVGAFGLGMVALNLTQYLRSPGGIVEIKAPDADALEEARKRQAEQASTRKPTQKELRMQSQLGAGGTTAALANGVPATPTIDMPSMRMPEPTFESEATTSQWYEKDSAQKAKADKNSGR